MADLTSPRATRWTPPRWWEPRLALGVLFVLVAVVGGARVMAGADRYSQVYLARHALVPGERLAEADLAVGRARLAGQAGLYLAAGRPPVGYVVTRYVGAHELVPLRALAPSPVDRPTRLVTVPVQPGHLPPGLGRGDLVDVYVTAKAGPGAVVPAPSLVLAGAAVDAREGGARSFAGESTLAVVLAVPADRVADVVRAVESGTIDLVLLPPAAAAGLTAAVADS
jgi:hypothetical protein